MNFSFNLTREHSKHVIINLERHLKVEPHLWDKCGCGIKFNVNFLFTCIILILWMDILMIVNVG